MSMKRSETPNADESISGVVRILLARDNMTRQDLARALRYDSSTITRSMAGERPWKIADLAAMAKVFDVPRSLFFEDPDSLVRKTCFRPVLVLT